MANLWHAEDEERLSKLVAEGYSGGQIARMMSSDRRVFSRSCVMGKVWRLGLKMARKASSTVGITRATGSRMPRRRKALGVVAPVADTLPTVVERSGQVARAAEPPRGGSRHHPPEGGYGPGDALLALEHGDCRWPIGEVGHRDFHFCRERALSLLPYCPAHTKAAKGTSSGHGWIRF